MGKKTGRYVLYNARIYTLDPRESLVTALVIEHGRIVDRGDQLSITSRYQESSALVDLEGKVVIPGLIDAHIHLQHYALSLQRVNCETSNRKSCLVRVAEQAKGTKPGDWIIGHGWNQNDWPEGFGDASQLDEIAPNNPVYLSAKSLHAAWVNSLALQKASIDSHTPDPPGGRIGLHENGTPSGLLFETAMSLVSDSIPKPSVSHVAKAIKEAQGKLMKMGITGVHDFDRRTCFVALQELNQSGMLRLRVTKSIPMELLQQAVDLGLQTGFGDEFLRIGSLKLFADGALGPRTAAMLLPYEGEPENRGLLILDAEDIVDIGSKAVENGISLAVHAIGDAANHEVLQAFEQLRNLEQKLHAENKFPLRHRVEHVQVIHPDDIPRLLELDLIASMQPIHATSDYPMADRYWGTRSKTAYAWNSLLEKNTKMAFGSDAPVDNPNPFWGLHAAVTRRRADGSPAPDGWYPEQKINMMKAIQGFTIGAAYAAGMENQLGKLSPGYHADLLVLEQDPFNIEPDQIREIRPLGTMIAGEWVYLQPKLADITSSA